MVSSSQGSAFSCSLMYVLLLLTMDQTLLSTSLLESLCIPPGTHLDIIIPTWQDKETCYRISVDLCNLVSGGGKLKLGSSMADSPLGSANLKLLNQGREAGLGQPQVQKTLESFIGCCL